MKRFIIFLSIIASSFSALAQEGKKDIVTEKFKVEGNCDMCKKRIEEAAYTKGVKRAEWNKADHTLTLTYKPSKTTADAVLASVAKVGHSSDRAEAKEADYNKLPQCCHYKTETCNH